MRLKTYKMAMSILPNFVTLKWNISRTIWRIDVGDGSFFCICHALAFELVLGQLPPGQLPPGQLPPDKYPPDNYPLGQIPPGQLPPQITEFPKHKSTKFTSHKVYKSQSLQVTKSTQITGTKSQYIRVQILQNTSKYKGSAWLWQTLVIWWLLKKPFWGGIKPKT